MFFNCLLLNKTYLLRLLHGTSLINVFGWYVSCRSQLCYQYPLLFPILPIMDIPISEWKNFVLEISTSLQSEKLKTLSGIPLRPRDDAELCYIYDGATVTTQIAYDGKKWRLFEYDKITYKHIELGCLVTPSLPFSSQHWELLGAASHKEVLVVHPWKRSDWEKKQEKLMEDSTAKANDFKYKLAEVECRLEKLKEASSHENSELRLAVKETEAMVETMKTNFCRDLKDVNIKLGEVTFAIGTVKKRQLATEEETKSLRDAQTNAAVQIEELKNELRQVARKEVCRCGSASLLRKFDNKLDKDIRAGEKIFIDRGNRLEEFEFERRDFTKRGAYCSKKGRTNYFRLEGVFVQDQCYECRSKRQRCK